MKPEDILQLITGKAADFIGNPADFIGNPERLDDLLRQAEEKLRTIPNVGETLSGLPVVIAMVKSWITKEYEVQPKVLVTIVAAFLYLVKKKDLIPDNLPIVGMGDDLAILGLALKYVEPEVNAYRAWRDQAAQAQAAQPQAEQAQAPQDPAPQTQAEQPQAEQPQAPQDPAPQAQTPPDVTAPAQA